MQIRWEKEDIKMLLGMDANGDLTLKGVINGEEKELEAIIIVVKPIRRRKLNSQISTMFG